MFDMFDALSDGAGGAKNSSFLLRLDIIIFLLLFISVILLGWSLRVLLGGF